MRRYDYIFDGTVLDIDRQLRLRSVENTMLLNGVHRLCTSRLDADHNPHPTPHPKPRARPSSPHDTRFILPRRSPKIVIPIADPLTQASIMCARRSPILGSRSAASRAPLHSSAARRAPARVSSATQRCYRPSGLSGARAPRSSPTRPLRTPSAPCSQRGAPSAARTLASSSTHGGTPSPCSPATGTPILALTLTATLALTLVAGTPSPSSLAAGTRSSAQTATPPTWVAAWPYGCPTTRGPRRIEMVPPRCAGLTACGASGRRWGKKSRGSHSCAPGPTKGATWPKSSCQGAHSFWPAFEL